MDVVLIGAGNVAHVLGRTLKRTGHNIKAIWNRDERKAIDLAKELSAISVQDIRQLPKDADIYILAVSDQAISELMPFLLIEQGILVHCAGTVSIQVLSEGAKKFGVFWPVKMMRTHMHQLDDCSIVVDGSDETTTELLKKLANQLSAHVTVADDSKRQKMHLIAAISSNFTNHMYHLAADYCKSVSIDFSLFYPLIVSATHQIQTSYPGDVQAGPAFRGDLVTIERHRGLLAGDPDLLKVYDAVTQSILHKFGH